MAIGIGFDIDHTLLIDNKLERIAFMRLLELVIIHGGRVIGTLTEEQERIDDLLNRQRHAGRSIDETVHEFVETHGALSAGHYVERYKEIALGLVDHVVIPIPGVRETLTELHARGISIAILTNGWNPLQTRKAHCVGFDGPLVVSSEIGVQKPDPRAFEMLRNVLGTSPENTWYVGDDPVTDISGARAVGFHAIWLDAEGKTYPGDLPQPTRIVHSLPEILTSAFDPV